MVSRARAMAERILKLRSAATLEQYNGPVLFEGDAAGEVFAQRFATGLMVVRTPSSDDARFEAFFNQMMSRLGGTSLEKVGGRVLPEFLTFPIILGFQITRALNCWAQTQLTMTQCLPVKPNWSSMVFFNIKRRNYHSTNSTRRSWPARLLRHSKPPGNTCRIRRYPVGWRRFRICR